MLASKAIDSYPLLDADTRAAKASRGWATGVVRLQEVSILLCAL